jgi:hypothetical protein
MTYICYEEKNFRDSTLALIDKANEIIEDYAGQGYTLTLRQLYYVFVSMAYIENSEKSYKNLGNTINDARMAGLISWDAIEDRGRGIRPWLIEENQKAVLDGIEYQYARDVWTPQNVYVEVWVEKEALSSVIKRPCQKYRVPYMPCKGYLSASEAWRSGQRYEEAMQAGKRCVLIHLGDHDPSGIDMTRDNDDRLDIFSGGGVEVQRIALNIDQVRQYNPPRNPTKVTDTRAKDYIKRFGHDCWELDALRPQVIDKLITDAIEGCIADRKIWKQVLAEEREARKPLAMLHGNWDRVKNYLANIETGQG